MTSEQRDKSIRRTVIALVLLVMVILALFVYSVWQKGGA